MRRTFGWICALLIFGLVACDSRRPVKRRPPPPPPAPTPDVNPAKEKGITAAETGAIMFACSNAPNHEDKEVLISACPACSKTDWFYQDPDGQGFFCYKCSAKMPLGDIKCPDCQRAPKRLRLKKR